MCLVTDQKRPFTAECDIVTYKLLHSDGTTIFSPFEYKLGKVYRTRIRKSNKIWGFDWEDSDVLYKVYGCDWKCRVIGYDKGFHSAIYPHRFDHTSKDDSCDRVFECIVPKGSKYYTNPSGLLVSNQIIIIKQINDGI